MPKVPKTLSLTLLGGNYIMNVKLLETYQFSLANSYFCDSKNKNYGFKMWYSWVA